MQEKRLTSRLIKYWWELLRKGQPLPLWEQFNQASFADVWQQCCGWTVEKDGSGTNLYTFAYIGEEVKEVWGGDLTGKVFKGKFPYSIEARVIERIDEVVNSRYPVTDEGESVNTEGQTIKFRSCLLPFGTEDGKVTNIVLGLSWKAF